MKLTTLMNRMIARIAKVFNRKKEKNNENHVRDMALIPGQASPAPAPSGMPGQN